MRSRPTSSRKMLPICMRFRVAASSSASASPMHRPTSAWRSSRASHLATSVPLSRSSSRTPNTGRCHLSSSLRKRMIALSAEIAEGLVFANRQPCTYGRIVGHPASGEARRSGFLYRQPYSHLYLRRRRRGKGGAAQHDGALLGDAELPKLLEGSRLPRRDDRGGSGDRRGTHR